MSRPLAAAASVFTLLAAGPAFAADGETASSAAFRRIVLPASQTGAMLTVYADEARFSRFFTEVVAPRFAKAHGVGVRFVVKPADVILAELANARDAGQAAPADLVLVGGRTQRRLLEAGLDQGVNLMAALPNARDVDGPLATVADAGHTGGAVVPFHVARQVVAYDSRIVSAEAVVSVEALANYASVNPGRFGYSRQADLGQRAHFAETITLAFGGRDCLGKVYDADLSPRAAEVFANGECGQKVVAYFRRLRRDAVMTRTPAELLLKLSRGDVAVAVIGEDDVAEAASRGAMPASIRVLAVPSQVAETVGLMVPVGTPQPAAALLLADDLMSTAVQTAKVEHYGSASARRSVRPSSRVAAWFARPAADDATVRARPVGNLADAVQRRLLLEIGDVAAR